MELARLIPQLFYDVIARVVPGTMAIVGISITIQVDLLQHVLSYVSGPSDLDKSVIVRVLALGAVGYVTGHLFGPLGDMIKCGLEKVIPKSYHVLREVVADRSRYPSQVTEFIKNEIGSIDSHATELHNAILYVWADWLRLNIPDAGARLVKLRAEYRMHLGNCIAGILVMSAAINYSADSSIAKNDFVCSDVMCLLGVAVAGLSALAHVKSFKDFQWSVINNYYAARKLK